MNVMMYNQLISKKMTNHILVHQAKTNNMADVNILEVSNVSMLTKGLATPGCG